MVAKLYSDRQTNRQTNKQTDRQTDLFKWANEDSASEAISHALSSMDFVNE